MDIQEKISDLQRRLETLADRL